MEYQEFIDKQEGIYNNLVARGEAVRRGERINDKKGLVAKLPEEGMEQREFLIYLGYEDPNNRMYSFNSHLEKTLTWELPISEDQLKLAEERGEEAEPIISEGEFKLIKYGRDKKNIHSTFASFDRKIVETDNMIKYFSKSEKDSIQKIGNAISDTIFESKGLKYPRIHNMGNFVHDESTVIIMPSNGLFEDFYNLREELLKNIEKQGVAVNPGWGAHVTAARFSKNIPFNKMEKFTKLMEYDGSTSWTGASVRWDDHPPLDDYGVWPLDPKTINIGEYVFNRSGFYLNPFVSFSLEPLKNKP
jgi:hypothetical protein